MLDKGAHSGTIFFQRVNPVKKQLARAMRSSPTPAERKLWNLLRGNQIVGMKFRRQQVIAGCIADFYCDRAKLIVEVDGTVHDSDDQRVRDSERRKLFEARGLHEIRFRNEEVLYQTDRVVEQIRTLVVKRTKDINEESSSPSPGGEGAQGVRS